MSGAWAITLKKGRAAALARLWPYPGLLVLEWDDHVWLRGNDGADVPEPEILSLPLAGRFVVSDEEVLTPHGQRVPTRTLPNGRWISLQAWMSVAFPQTRMSAASTRRWMWHMEPGGVEVESNVLLVPIQLWAQFGIHAARARLDPLRFAVSGDGLAAVRGVPLPPLPGTRFVERDGVALPAGQRLCPAVSAAVIRQVLRLSDGELALLWPDRYEVLADDCFVAATRSALRASQEYHDD